MFSQIALGLGSAVVDGMPCVQHLNLGLPSRPVGADESMMPVTVRAAPHANASIGALPSGFTPSSNSFNAHSSLAHAGRCPSWPFSAFRRRPARNLSPPPPSGSSLALPCVLPLVFRRVSRLVQALDLSAPVHMGAFVESDSEGAGIVQLPPEFGVMRTFPRSAKVEVAPEAAHNVPGLMHDVHGEQASET
eukprot:73440-Pleurochrysis_carterae.AAC.2